MEPIGSVTSRANFLICKIGILVGGVPSVADFGSNLPNFAFRDIRLIA